MTDVVPCTHRPTPIGRYAGPLDQVHPNDLATRVIDGLPALHDLPIDEVIFGCANHAGEDNRSVARMATLLSRLGPRCRHHRHTRSATGRPRQSSQAATKACLPRPKSTTPPSACASSTRRWRNSGAPTPFWRPSIASPPNFRYAGRTKECFSLLSQFRYAAAVSKHHLTPLVRKGQSASGGVCPGSWVSAQSNPPPVWQNTPAALRRTTTSSKRMKPSPPKSSQVLACTRARGTADDDPCLNAHGGPIAMGHLLNMSGARLAGTAARCLFETGAGSALVTFCVGVGQGVALELLPA